MNTNPAPATTDDDVSGDLGGEYLKAEQFSPNETMRFRIVAVTREHFEARKGRPEADKRVLTLDGQPPRKFSLNKTNLRTLASAWGKHASAWVGRTIDIWHNPAIEFGGQIVGGLRVRIPPPTPPTTPTGDASDSEAPF